MAECRELLRQGHTLLKDLRVATREAETVTRQAAAGAVAERIEQEVAKQLAELGDLTRREMDRAVARVGRKFDELAKLYMQGEGRGNVSLDELAAARQTIRIDAETKKRAGRRR
jgi:hypothetical protein